MFFKKSLLIVQLLLLCLWSSLQAHPVHVALTSIEYDGTKEMFDVSFKIFWDDLERVIATKYKVTLKLTNEKENPQEKEYLDRYIRENFRLVVNDGSPAEPVYEGKKISDKAIWLTFHIPCREKVKKVYIYNTVMMDMFCDQTDLLIFKYGDMEKGVSLNVNKYEVTFNVK
jgi:hypothetical protein